MVKMFENTTWKNIPDMLEFNNQKISDILLPNTILMLVGCALSGRWEYNSHAYSLEKAKFGR